MSKKKDVIQVALVIVVLGAGIGMWILLSSLRKEPPKRPKQIYAPLLNAQIVKTEDVQVTVPGFGSVQPKVEVTVIPQVAGRIIDCHKDFVNGGFFKAGEALVVIDPNDYELAVESAEAAVKQAEVAYEKELAEQKVALQEWEQIHPGEDPNSPLVTRELQVKFALADYKAAQARLSDAKLDLERTVIKMPFDGRVDDESVDIGQYIPVGQPIATVYSTAAVEIAVPLADEQLAWFDVPGGYTNGSNSIEGKGSKVEVTAEFAGGVHCWPGQVIRTLGQIDPISRMVHVIVEVEDPFKLENSRPPLVPGMFVQVDILGSKVKDIIRVPRYAIRNGSEVWVEREKPVEQEDAAEEKDTAEKNKTPEEKEVPVEEENAEKLSILKIIKVNIVRMDRQNAYITEGPVKGQDEGIADGDVVIVSPLDIVTDGMDIRTNILNPEKTEPNEIKEIKVQ